MNEPLVTVVVCMYNSSKTVIETLESVRLQTYKNVELIISDDDSRDDSVQICKKWVEDNKDHFQRSLIITHTPNTGTASNMNRAIKASKGEWIKGIAADDKLLPNCISDFVEYVLNHQETGIVFSKVVAFGNIEAAKTWTWGNVKKYFEEFNERQKRIILSTENFLPAASVFLKKSVWSNLGGYDESIPLVEDWPLWIKAVSKGYKLGFMDKDSVAYRFSESSVSQGIKPLSKIYKDNVNMACLYAERSLKTINFFYHYLLITRRLLRTRWNLKKVVTFLNIINPAYYEYERTIEKFNKMRYE